jgi:glycosyltransferase involved in cell wall biosynthesis
MPRVSVVMPVYNGAAHVGEAIASILAQSFADFELLLLDDGSTDASPAILRSFQDPRIRVLENGRNLGLIATLNRGFAEARGEYLVRMDADDVALPRRIEQQVEFLDRHPDIGVLGTAFELFGAQSGVVRHVGGDAPLRIAMLFECALCHPSVAIRRAAVPLPLYDPAYLHAEDYEAWIRLMLAGTRFAVLPDVLVRYRTHAAQVSRAGQAAQVANADRARQQWFRALGMTPSPEELALHRAVGTYAPCPDAATFRRLEGYLAHLDRANRATGVFDPDLLRRELASRLRGLLLDMPAVGWDGLRVVLRSTLSDRTTWRRTSFWRIVVRAVGDTVRGGH